MKTFFHLNSATKSLQDLMHIVLLQTHRPRLQAVRGMSQPSDQDVASNTVGFGWWPIISSVTLSVGSAATVGICPLDLLHPIVFHRWICRTLIRYGRSICCTLIRMIGYLRIGPYDRLLLHPAVRSATCLESCPKSVLGKS